MEIKLYETDVFYIWGCLKEHANPSVTKRFEEQIRNNLKDSAKVLDTLSMIRCFEEGKTGEDPGRLF